MDKLLREIERLLNPKLRTAEMESESQTRTQRINGSHERTAGKAVPCLDGLDFVGFCCQDVEELPTEKVGVFAALRPNTNLKLDSSTTSTKDLLESRPVPASLKWST